MKGEQHSGGDEGREHDDRQAAAANRGAETSDEEHDEESTTHSTLGVGWMLTYIYSLRNAAVQPC